ncbi:hypothetical protein Acsp01_09710 [Actinoplanes sp. NBRC 101535]|nr:hypothetical protein Acsp01_09710 [Actinoplanes sp. NBRC 101535]
MAARSFQIRDLTGGDLADQAGRDAGRRELDDLGVWADLCGPKVISRGGRHVVDRESYRGVSGLWWTESHIEGCPACGGPRVIPRGVRLVVDESYADMQSTLVVRGTAPIDDPSRQVGPST